MARRRSRTLSTVSNYRHRRVVFNNANALALPRAVLFPPRSLSKLLEFEDRRIFNPERQLAPARSYSKARHRLVLSARTTVSPGDGLRRRPAGIKVKQFIAFHAPDQVLTCVRRKIRREVIHAKGIAGKSGQKRPSKNWRSQISC